MYQRCVMAEIREEEVFKLRELLALKEQELQTLKGAYLGIEELDDLGLQAVREAIHKRSQRRAELAFGEVGRVLFSTVRNRVPAPPIGDGGR